MGSVMLHGVQQTCVTSFNGYIGAVMPRKGDYKASLITTSSGNTVQDYANKHNIKEITIDTSLWSSGTVALDGSNYYVATVTGLTVYDQNCNVSLGASGTVPTTAEELAYNCIKYAITDTAKGSITLYATSVPTSSFIIRVKGVA